MMRGGVGAFDSSAGGNEDRRPKSTTPSSCRTADDDDNSPGLFLASGVRQISVRQINGAGVKRVLLPKVDRQGGGGHHVQP